MVKQEFIYEIVDNSDDEVYYPLGVFSSLESAIFMIESWENDPELDNSSEFFQQVTVTERPLDKCQHGKEVYRRAWYFDMENGEWAITHG